MATQQKKKRRYYKNSLYDRATYYLGKATKKNSSQYDQDYAVGYLDGMYCKPMSKVLGKEKAYINGYMRSSNSLEIARNVKF